MADFVDDADTAQRAPPAQPAEAEAEAEQKDPLAYYDPPGLRAVPGILCAACFRPMDSPDAIGTACDRCGFVLCNHPECAGQEEARADLETEHAQEICPLQRFEHAQVIVANAFADNLRGPSITFAMALHQLAAQTSLGEIEYDRFCRSLRTSAIFSALLDIKVGKQTVASKNKNKNKKKQATTTLGALSIRMLKNVHISSYATQALDLLFVMLIIQAMPRPDQVCALFQIFQSINSLVKQKLTPQTVVDLDSPADAAKSRVATIPLVLLDADCIEAELRCHALSVPNNSLLGYFEHELGQIAVGPVNVCYLITLVHPGDATRPSLTKRRATTQLLVRFMATTGGQNAWLLVTQMHSTLYSLEHWISPSLYYESAVENAQKSDGTLASSPDDFDVVLVDDPRVPKGSEKEWFSSQRVHWLDKTNRFQGLKQDDACVKEMRALGTAIDLLTNPKASAVARHEAYTELTGVRWPNTPGRELVPFQAIVARANLVI